MNITKESTATTTPQFTQMTADKDALLREALHYVTYAHKHEDQCGCQRCNLRACITAALAGQDATINAEGREYCKPVKAADNPAVGGISSPVPSAPAPQGEKDDGWIKCSERLPEPGQQVVIARKNGTWDRGECNPLYFDGLPAWYLPEGPTFTEDVAYWRPLPPLPKGE